MKKAERNNLYVKTINTEEGVEMFFNLLMKLRIDKFKILPQSDTFYLKLYNYFVKNGYGNIWFTFLGDKPIGSAFILDSNHAIYDKMGVSHLDYLEYRPNNLLLWEVMKYGCARDKVYLDLGLSPADNKGLIKFKDTLGGEKTPINYYRYLPSNYDTERESKQKKLLSDLTELISNSKISPDIVKQYSSLLYRFFC